MACDPKERRKILIVEDDPFVCEALTMLLQFEGHTVKTAANGHHALAIFQPGKFDLIITDFVMPAMSGDRLAAEIKALDPRQPVVLATAYAEKLDGPGCSSLPVDQFIAKPFEIQSLRETIARLTPVGFLK